jgi:hypothetical protein
VEMLTSRWQSWTGKEGTVVVEIVQAGDTS